MSWFGRAGIILTVVALGSWLPTLFFDDAYITFRYASNISLGTGFTYNPPERVLGVTTPLFTLLLALAAWIGADIETTALVLGLAGHALLGLLVFEIASLLVRTSSNPPAVWTRLFPALACAVHPHLAFTAVGGMETSLYCAVIIGTFLFAARGRELVAGALLGVAILLRPDAVILAPLALWLTWVAKGGSRASAIARLAGLSTLVVMPWITFSTWYFGSFVPHSIPAKRLIHDYGVLQVLSEYLAFLKDDVQLIILMPLALAGIWLERRRPLVQALTLFILLYLLGYALGGVEPFPWYVNPLIPIVFLLSATGLAVLAERIGFNRLLFWAVVLALAVTQSILDLRRMSPELQQAWNEWEGTYEIASHWIMDHSDTGDRILVGEVGVIGYLLPGRVIIDSSGINSPEVYLRRVGRDETDPEWTRRVVVDLRPDFITTYVSYLNIQTIARERWFDLLYERVPLPLVDRGGQVIYRRRPGR